MNGEKLYKVHFLDKWFIYFMFFLLMVFAVVFIIINFVVGIMMFINFETIINKVLFGAIFIAAAVVMFFVFTKKPVGLEFRMATEVIMKESGELVFKNRYFENVIRISDLVSIKTKSILRWSIFAIEFKTANDKEYTLGSGDGFSEMIKEIKKKNPGVQIDIF